MIKVATAYSYQGQTLESFPASIDVLEHVEVIYETLPGWKQPTTSTKTYEDLPHNARSYVEWIEAYVGVPITHIGTGKARAFVLPRLC